MPKPYTFPTLYDEALQINITRLKEWGYILPDQIKLGTIYWGTIEKKVASISIKVDTQIEYPYIELDYKYREDRINYKIRLVSIASNLGKGAIWYFQCPHTNKRCRKLYSINGYFLHREAFQGCMYESQTQSKKYRQLDKTLGTYFKADDLYSQLNKKNFKKTYAGKPTKRYLYIFKQLKELEKELSSSEGSVH